MFIDKILHDLSGAMLYGITPPKEKTAKEKLLTITEKRTNRINNLHCDALVVYDIQDESSRTNEARPFEYFPTLDPLSYATTYHARLDCQKIIYHVVGKYTEEELRHRIAECAAQNYLSVFVGAASNSQRTRIKLADAYALWNAAPQQQGGLGGVVIPERHRSKQDEHLRILEKQRRGCSFFISQCVCNLEIVKNFISDYCWEIEDRGEKNAYMIFTLSICGSTETLRLMNWLGIDIPKWLKNDLARSKDILESSIKLNLNIAKDLYEYCREKHLACGFNVESISPKKEEIAATEILFHELKKHLAACE